MQSSPWANFKGMHGWSTIRLILRRNAAIVGGVQLLVRMFPPRLKVARAPQGPVLAGFGSDLVTSLLTHLIDLMDAQRIDYMALQPETWPNDASGLQGNGFTISPFLGEKRATLIIELTQRTEKLLQQMRRTTRNNIRRAHDNGVLVREGTEVDLSIFYNHLVATAIRQRFVPRYRSYYSELWQCLSRTENIRLFVTEYHGEAISSLLVIPYGDTVTVEAFGWSGARRQMRPNEALVWKAMEWSKSNGYKRFNLGGIHASAAQALLGGASLPGALRCDATRFKLGFGGAIVLLPVTHEHISNRGLRLFLHGCSTIVGKRNLVEAIQRALATDKRGLNLLRSFLQRSAGR